METQIELLTTGTLIKRAMLETGLNTTLRPSDKPRLTYWRWLFYDGGKTSSFQPGPQSLQVVNATLTGHYRLETGPDNSYRLYAVGRPVRRRKARTHWNHRPNGAQPGRRAAGALCPAG